MCQQRGWASPDYIDLLPEAHLPGFHTLELADHPQTHPFYKTRRCQKHEELVFQGGCPLGPNCPFAHSEEELRPAPIQDQRFLFEIHLNASGRNICKRGVEPKAHRSEAKAEVALLCFMELGVVPPLHLHANLGVSDLDTGKPRPELSKTKVKQFLNLLKNMALQPTMIMIAEGGGESEGRICQWISALGGMFGSVKPAWMALIRQSNLRSFRAFMDLHAHECGTLNKVYNDVRISAYHHMRVKVQQTTQTKRWNF
jgi:hypothetical protein